MIPKTAKVKDGIELELPWARRSTLEDIVFTFTMALKIIVYEPMVLSLGLYNGACITNAEGKIFVKIQP